MKNIIVISFNEDGDLPGIENISEELLCERLSEEYYGKRKVYDGPLINLNTSTFVGLIVIRGELVKPEAVETVTKWRIP